MSGSSLNAATIAVRAEAIDGTTAYTALDVQGWTTFRSKEGEHDRSDDVWGASIDRWPHRSVSSLPRHATDRAAHL